MLDVWCQCYVGVFFFFIDFKQDTYGECLSKLKVYNFYSLPLLGCLFVHCAFSVLSFHLYCQLFISISLALFLTLCLSFIYIVVWMYFLSFTNISMGSVLIMTCSLMIDIALYAHIFICFVLLVAYWYVWIFFYSLLYHSS